MLNEQHGPAEATRQQAMANFRLQQENYALATQLEKMARRLRRRTLALGGGLVLTTSLAIVEAVAYLLPSPAPTEQAAAALPGPEPQLFVEPRQSMVVRTQSSNTPTYAGPTTPRDEPTSLMATPTAPLGSELEPMVEPAPTTVVHTRPTTTPIDPGPLTTPDERTPLKATLTTSPTSRGPDQTVQPPASSGPALTPIGVPATDAEKAPGLRAALADIRQQISERSQIGTVAAASSPIVRLDSLEPPLRELEARE